MRTHLHKIENIGYRILTRNFLHDHTFESISFYDITANIQAEMIETLSHTIIQPSAKLL